MKKKMLLFFLISMTSVYSQWDVLAPEPLYEPLGKAYFLNNDTGFVCAEEGLLLKTTDGFLTHKRIPIPSTGEVSKFEFVDDSTRFVLTKEYEVLKTTDGGESWIKLNDPLFVYPMDITFIDRNIGWIMNWTSIINTTDGGMTWNFQTSQVYPGKLKFINENTGFFVSYFGTLWISTNGGENWIERSVPGNTFRDLVFRDNLTGIVAAETQDLNKTVNIHLTTDGGINWTIIPTNIISYYLYSSLYFRNSTIILQNYEAAFRSDDLGSSWEIIPPSQRADLYLSDIYYRFQTGGMILKSTNRGNTWKHFGSRHGGERVVFFDSLNGATAPWYTTTDGGNTWTYKENFSFPVTVYGDYAYHLFSPEKALFGYGNTVYTTSDGGVTWDSLFNYYDEFISQFFFVDSLYGWMYSIKGMGNQQYTQGIRKTTDGGISWTNFLPAGGERSSIYFVTRYLGFVYNHYWNTFGVKTTDGGATFHAPYFSKSRSICFVDTLTGFARTYQNELIKTTDGGSTYEIIQYNFTGENLFFISSNIGWYGSDTIFITTNGGADWTAEFDPEWYFVKSFTKGPNGKIFAAGNSGMILKRSAVVTDVSGDHPGAPAYYTLEQNFPNPFNPVTSIRYSLPENSYVRLSVFNVLGESVEILVDETQTAGNYEIEWNGHGYSSGIYFLKINSQSDEGVIRFTELKKMVLMK